MVTSVGHVSPRQYSKAGTIKIASASCFSRHVTYSSVDDPIYTEELCSSKLVCICGYTEVFLRSLQTNVTESPYKWFHHCGRAIRTHEVPGSKFVSQKTHIFVLFPTPLEEIMGKCLKVGRDHTTTFQSSHSQSSVLHKLYCCKMLNQSLQHNIEVTSFRSPNQYFITALLKFFSLSLAGSTALPTSVASSVS
jgi:hypothetical protein